MRSMGDDKDTRGGEVWRDVNDREGATISGAESNEGSECATVPVPPVCAD